MGKVKKICMTAVWILSAAAAALIYVNAPFLTVSSEVSDGNLGGGESEDDGMKLLALTFDDGPKNGTTDVLLDGLKERGIRATFFLIGMQIKDNEEIVRRMYREGHQIGNHTFEHVNLADVSCDSQKCQLFLCSEALSGVIGKKPDFIRPPFGEISEDLKAWADVPVILWSVDTMDWTGKSREEIAEYIADNVRPGDIVLMHDIYEESVAGALMAADALKREGYKLVTVSELFAANGIEPQAGKVYRKGD